MSYDYSESRAHNELAHVVSNEIDKLISAHIEKLLHAGADKHDKISGYIAGLKAAGNLLRDTQRTWAVRDIDPRQMKLVELERV